MLNIQQKIKEILDSFQGGTFVLIGNVQQKTSIIMAVKNMNPHLLAGILEDKKIEILEDLRKKKDNIQINK